MREGIKRHPEGVAKYLQPQGLQPLPPLTRKFAELKGPGVTGKLQKTCRIKIPARLKGKKYLRKSLIYKNNRKAL